MMRLILLLSSLLLVAMVQANTRDVSPATRTVYISIIIDDIGNNLQRDRRFAELNAPLTLAILPHTPHAIRLADLAYQQQKDVMLHMPMSSVHGYWPGPGALNTQMVHEEFIQQVRKNLSAIPHIVGVNNHMGSQLTPSEQHMQWLMAELKSVGIGYYIDSMTSRLSLARVSAQRSGIPTLRRDVFLDNDKEPNSIRRQFQRLLHVARQRGYAVAIGHPYDETLEVLQQELEKLDVSVKLVPVSQLFELSIYREPTTWHASSSP